MMPGAYGLRSSSSGLTDLNRDLFDSKTRATLGDRSCEVAAPKLWNFPASRGSFPGVRLLAGNCGMPHEIRSNISNINTFKRKFIYFPS